MLANREVEVACVKVAEEVPVIVPTMRLPMEEEATNSLVALSIVAKKEVVVD